MAATTLVPLSGCDLIKGAKEMFKEIEQIRSDLKSEYGVDAGVNVRVVNGFKTVSVQFASPPTGSVGDIKQRVTEIVRKHMGDSTAVKITM